MLGSNLIRAYFFLLQLPVACETLLAALDDQNEVRDLNTLVNVLPTCAERQKDIDIVTRMLFSG